MQTRLQRLAEFDLVTRFQGRVPMLLVQLLFGIACIIGFIAVRTSIDAVAPTAGPFAPIYPLVLISTLFGRWRAGVVTYAGCFAWVWFVVLPQAAGLHLPRPGDFTRTAVSASTVMVVLVFAEIFRRAVRRAVSQRDEAIGALQLREEELERLNLGLETQVAERTRELSRTWQVSPDLLARLGPDGKVQASNPAWATTLGWAEGTVAQRDFAELIHPDDYAAARQAWAELSAGAPAVRLKIRLRHEDGPWVWLAWVVVPEGGGYLCSARDVTQEELQAQQLAAVQEALRQSQKLEAIGQLTGGVAHDFNNLLTIILGSVELLRRPHLDAARRDRHIAAIADTADRAARLTGQLLAFARRQTLQPETFECADAIADVTTMIRALAGSSMEVVTELPERSCFILADRSQFETAILNMAINARDAMDGRGTLTISIAAARAVPAIRMHGAASGDFVAIRLRDTGSGIPAEHLARIFEPFFTTKSQGKGTGLGLSQVIGFAKQSGGDVEVESREGEGTVFTLYLPRASATGPPPAAVPSRPAPADGAGACVLLVEDNIEVGDFAAQALDDLGYASILTRNADEALTELERDAGRFQIVFSDVVMPGMSGLELARRVRERWPQLPILLTSGYSTDLSEGGTQGFTVLSKPYAIEQLSDALQAAMAG